MHDHALHLELHRRYVATQQLRSWLPRVWWKPWTWFGNRWRAPSPEQEAAFKRAWEKHLKDHLDSVVLHGSR